MSHICILHISCKSCQNLPIILNFTQSIYNVSKTFAGGWFVGISGSQTSVVERCQYTTRLRLQASLTRNIYLSNSSVVTKLLYLQKYSNNVKYY